MAKRNNNKYGERKKTEEILENLRNGNISPLALPGYIAQCEFYDMQDAHEVLAKAVNDFREQGGVAGNLAHTMFTSAANGCCMILLKKFHEPTYQQAVKGKVNILGIIEQCLNFKYPEMSQAEDANSASNNMIDGMRQRHLHRAESNQKGDYKRDTYEDTKRMENYRNSRFASDEKGVKDDIRRSVVYKTEDATTTDKRINYVKYHQAVVDHVVPLKVLHEQYNEFSSRYVTDSTVKSIANSDENFQLISFSDNSSKGSKTNAEFIEHKKKQGHPLNSEEAARLEQSHQQAKKHIEKELLKAGSQSVILEQIGKILETIAGPISFEIRDAIQNGVTAGFSSDNPVSCMCSRIYRAMKYTVGELPRLIGDFLGDLGQMLATFFASVCKFVRDIFGKFLNVIISGFSVIVESVKILMVPGERMSFASKGDAICKLIGTFAVNILGTYLIDMALNSLGLPDPFSEILAVLISSTISAIVAYLLNKVDLFNIKEEVLRQRITEVFDLRVAQIKHDAAQFDIAVMERLRVDKIKMEEHKVAIRQAIEDKDMKRLNVGIDQLAQFFHVEIPYSSPADFVRYLRENTKIFIGC